MADPLYVVDEDYEDEAMWCFICKRWVPSEVISRHRNKVHPGVPLVEIYSDEEDDDEVDENGDG